MTVVDVPAHAGIGWLRDAFRAFAQQPVRWISLMSCWLITCFLLVALLRGLGVIAVFILQPGFFAGFVLAARDQADGRLVTAAHLVAGFRQAGRPLILVGLLSMAAYTASLSAVMMIDMPTLADLGGRNASQEALMTAMRAWIEARPWFIAAVAVIDIALRMLFWFTGPLLALNPMPAGHALRWAFYALIANFWPMVVFSSACWAMMALGANLLLVGLLVALPVYAIAHYTSYLTVFRQESPPPADVQSAG